MTLEDIEDVKKEFVNAALFAQECDYDGVQVHAAHGCEFARRLEECASLRALG